MIQNRNHVLFPCVLINDERNAWLQRHCRDDGSSRAAAAVTSPRRQNSSPLTSPGRVQRNRGRDIPRSCDHRHQTTRMNFVCNLNPKHHPPLSSNGTRDAERPEAGSHPSQVAQEWTTFHLFAPSPSAGSRRRARAKVAKFGNLIL